MQRAPITAVNFLRYAIERRFDGTFFYRAAGNKTATINRQQIIATFRIISARRVQ